MQDFGFCLRLTDFTGKPILFQPVLGATHCNKKGYRQFFDQLRRHGVWAARVRRQADFPGLFLVRFPPAILALPGYRLLVTGGRALRWGVGPFFRFLALSPIVAWGLWVRAWHFFRGAIGCEKQGAR